MSKTKTKTIEPVDLIEVVNRIRTRSAKVLLLALTSVNSNGELCKTVKYEAAKGCYVCYPQPVKNYKEFREAYGITMSSWNAFIEDMKPYDFFIKSQVVVRVKDNNGDKTKTCVRKSIIVNPSFIKSFYRR